MSTVRLSKGLDKSLNSGLVNLEPARNNADSPGPVGHGVGWRNGRELLALEVPTATGSGIGLG